MADESTPAVRGPLSGHQKSAVARMTVQGLSPAIIGSAIRKSPATVRRLVQEDEDIQKLMTEYENKVILQVGLHKFEMMEKLGRCREIVDEGLYAPDLKTRLETAKWTIESTMPKEVERVDVNLNVDGQIELAKAVPILVDHVTNLREVGGSPSSFKRHVVEELPGATTLRSTEEKQDDPVHPVADGPTEERPGEYGPDGTGGLTSSGSGDGG